MAHEPTMAELKDVWKRAGLWRSGHTFEQDIQVPVIVWCLKAAIRARQKTNPAPDQGVLI